MYRWFGLLTYSFAIWTDVFKCKSQKGLTVRLNRSGGCRPTPIHFLGATPQAQLLSLPGHSNIQTSETRADETIFPSLIYLMKPQNELIPHRPRNITIRLFDSLVINDTSRIIRINRRDQQFYYYLDTISIFQTRISSKNTYLAKQSCCQYTSSPHSQTPRTTFSSPRFRRLSSGLPAAIALVSRHPDPGILRRCDGGSMRLC